MPDTMTDTQRDQVMLVPLMHFPPGLQGGLLHQVVLFSLLLVTENKHILGSNPDLEVELQHLLPIFTAA